MNRSGNVSEDARLRIPKAAFIGFVVINCGETFSCRLPRACDCRKRRAARSAWQSWSEGRDCDRAAR
eukprot:7584516-Pyramimonas_sp.AAC.1